MTIENTLSTPAPPKASVVAAMNPKGSTAKSTLVAALAHIAAASGLRVLVCDLDDQGDVTDWLGGDHDTPGIAKALQMTAATLGAGEPTDADRDDLRRMVGRIIQRTQVGVDLIASSADLERLARRWDDLRDDGDGDGLVVDLVSCIADDYDLVLLDCKGDLGAVARSALTAADWVLAVTEPTQKAMLGVTRLIEHADRHGVDHDHVVVVPVKIWPRNRGADRDDFYRVTMPNRYAHQLTPPMRGASNLEQALAARTPVSAHDPNSGVSTDLSAIWADLADRGVANRTSKGGLA